MLKSGCLVSQSSVSAGQDHLAGAPGRIRTRDPLLRRQLLCPAELRAPADNCARQKSHVGHVKIAVCRAATADGLVGDQAVSCPRGGQAYVCFASLWFGGSDLSTMSASRPSAWPGRQPGFVLLLICQSARKKGEVRDRAG